MEQRLLLGGKGGGGGGGRRDRSSSVRGTVFGLLKFLVSRRVHLILEASQDGRDSHVGFPVL